MIGNYGLFKTSVVRVRPVWLIFLVGTALALLPLREGQAALFLHPPAHGSIGGVEARLVPSKGATWVKAELVCTGPSDVLVSPPGAGRWKLDVVALPGGRPAQRTPAGERMAMFGGRPTAMPATSLAPGRRRAALLRIEDYFVLKSPGRYIAKADRWVGIRGHPSVVCMATNLLELDLGPNGKIKWKTHGVVWPTPSPVSRIPPTVLAASAVPRTGPVAAFVRLAQAMKTGDTGVVRAAVYDLTRKSAVSAQMAALIACVRLRQEAERRLGHGEASLLRLPFKPEGLFQQIQRIDLKTLRVRKDSASVKYWNLEPGMDGGRARWELSGQILFRQVNGRWFVTGTPVNAGTSAATSVEYQRKIASALDDSRKALHAGKLSALGQLQRFLNSRLRRVDLWMWQQQKPKSQKEFHRAVQRGRAAKTAAGRQ